MRILCLSKFALPHICGETICVGKLLRALVAAGHDVRLITRRELPDTIESAPMPGPGWESVGCATTYIKKSSDSRAGLWKRWMSTGLSLGNPYCIPFHEDAAWVHAAERTLIDEVDSFGPDVVLTTLPRCDHLAALRARRGRNFLWIASLNDPWDRRTMFGEFPRSSLSHIYNRRVISLIASQADAFVFPSKRLAIFERQFSFGPWPSLVEVIPHVGATAEKAAPRVQGKFRLIHAGDLRPGGRADCLLPEGLARAIRTEPDLRGNLDVVFVGEVPEHFRRRMASLIGLAFQWIPPCPYPTALEYIASADVNLVIERKSSVSILMQAKLADYAMADAPILVLGNRVGNTADLAERGQCFHAVSDDADEIAQRVLMLYRAWTAGELGSYRHDALRQMCRPESAAKKFEALVASATRLYRAPADREDRAETSSPSGSYSASV